MASTGSSGVVALNSGGSEKELEAMMAQRKRKRMLSNRESAQRSRMRKQKHLDELTAQVSLLRAEKHHMLTTLNNITQHHVVVEAQNFVLRTQLMELTNRLDSLNDILNYMNGITANNNNAF